MSLSRLNSFADSHFIRRFSTLMLRLIAVLLFMGFLANSATAQVSGNKEAQTLDGMPLTSLEVGQTFQYRLVWQCSFVDNVPADGCGPFTITDNLPDGVIVESCVTTTDYDSSGAGCTAGASSVSIPKIGGVNGINLGDGDSAEALIVVSLSTDPADFGGTLPTSIVNTALFDSGQPDVMVTSDVPLNEPGNNWKVSKVATIPISPLEPALDNDAKYRIEICPDGPAGIGTGTIPLTDVTLTDACEAGATFVNARRNGSPFAPDVGFDTCPNLQFSLGTLDPDDGCDVLRITLQYPSGTFADDGSSTVVNTATATDSVEGALAVCDAPCSNSTSQVIAPANPDAAVSKSGRRAVLAAGSLSEYTFTADLNDSNVELDGVEIIDTFPAGVTGVSLSSLSWLDDSITANIYKLPSVTPFATAYDGSTSVSTSFSAMDTGFRIEFLDALPPGFQITGPTVRFRVDSGVALNTPIENCVDITGDANGTPVATQNCSTFTVEDPIADIRSLKSMPDSILPGEEFTATLSISQDFTSSAGAVNPVIVECLPPELGFISWDDVIFSGLDDPRDAINTVNNLSLGVLPNIEVFGPMDAGNNCPMPSGGMLRWSWKSVEPAGALQLGNAAGVSNSFTLPVRRDNDSNNQPDAVGALGVSVSIGMEVTLQVLAGTPATSSALTNNSFVQPESGRFQCIAGQVVDANDLDSDGSIVDLNCQSSADFNVPSAAAVGGAKFIGGFPGLENIDPNNPPSDATAGDAGITPAYCPQGADGRTRTPCVAQGMTGQPFNYQVRLSNDGNVGLVNYIAYDVLPFIGDTGITQIQSGTARDSSWTAEILGPIMVSSANATVQAELAKIGDPSIDIATRPRIEYSASTNPCREEMAQGADGPWQSTCVDDWTETPLADPITFPNGYGSVAAWRLVLPFDGSVWPATSPANPSDEDVVVDIPMLIPAGTPGSVYDTDSLAIAFNNIGHRATNANSNGRLLAAEMRKSGIVVPAPFPVDPPGTVRIGNLVWMDTNNDGVADPGEAGLFDVTVQLWVDTTGDGPSADDVLFDQLQTDAVGHYLFDDSDPRGTDGNLGTADDVRDNLGFAPGDYYVVIPDAQIGSFDTTQFYSSTGSGDNTDADDDTDNDDNGAAVTPAITAVGGDVIEGIFSGTVDLSLNNEPENEETRDSSGDADDGGEFFADDNSNKSVDFGFYQLRLGNHIWLDDGAGANTNDGIADSDEAAIEGMLVELWEDTDSDMMFDPTLDTQIVTASPVITDANGQYLFEGLDIGNYFVAIPAGQSGIGADGDTYSSNDLVSSASVPGTLGDDNVDDGTPGTFGGIDYAAVSPLYPLNVTTASSAEADLSDGGITGTSSTDVDNANVELSINLANNASLPDSNSFMTADFSFVPTVNLGSTIWIDIDGDGRQEEDELPMGNVTVTLLNADGSLYDSTPLTPLTLGDELTVLTDAAGQYHFNSLPPGTYRIRVDLSTSNVSDINIYTPTPVQVTDADASGVNSNLDSNLDFDFDTTGVNMPGDLIHFSAPITLRSGTEPTDEEDPISAGGGSNGDTDQPMQAGFLDSAGNMTLDMGFVPPVSLGSTLWIEVDANGVQNSGEEAIEGATVTLLDGSGALYDSNPYMSGVQSVTTTSTADGEYFFNGLPAGDYRVRVELPASLSTLIPTPVQTADPGNNNQLDSNIVGGSTVTDIWQSGTITLQAGTEPELETDPINEAGDGTSTDVDQPGQDLLPDDDPDNAGNMTLDFGFIRPVSLGSRVWIDANSDGLQSMGEALVSGVIVTLLNSDGSLFDSNPNNSTPDPVTDITDSNGQYNFNNLPAGNYRVQIDLGVASSLQPTPIQVADPEPVGVGPYVNVDSNIDAMAPGQNIAANIYQSGVVSLSVGDEPAAALETDLFAATDQPNQTADQPDTSGNMTVDFGLVAPVSIGSVVWLDANGDGIQNEDSNDDAEPGIVGATVTLLREDPFMTGVFSSMFNDLAGTLVIPQTTMAGGAYFFDNLPPGNYKVQVTTPDATFFPTIDQSAADNTIETDSNINLAVTLPANTYESGVINLLGGMEVVETGTPVNNDAADNAAIATNNSGNMTVDFGFYNPVSIGSLVWEDIDGDGIQDLGEPPILVGTVRLLDGNGVPVTTDINNMMIGTVNLATGSNGTPGTYQFSDLPPGDYQIQVSGLAPGFGPSPVQTTAGNNDTANDSNILAQPTTGVYVSGVFDLENGNEPLSASETTAILAAGDTADVAQDANGNMTVDFGFVQTVSIGSLVWQDANGNSVQDAGEALINEGTVTLLNPDGSRATGLNGVMIAEINLATSGGTYFFGNLPEASYIVQVTVPVAYQPVPTQSAVQDDNGANELDSNIFSDLGAGVYRSGIVMLAFGTEMAETENDGIAGDGDNADNAATNAGDMTVDFGFLVPVSIASYVWNDADGDGIQDGGTAEAGIEGATLTLYRETVIGSGTFVQVTTDIDGATIGVAGTLTTLADGLYEFDNLPPGNYKVRVTPPANYEPSLVQDGADNSDTLASDELDSNVNINTLTVLPLGTYESGEFLLTSGGELAESNSAEGDGQDDTSTQEDLSGNMTVDFGFVYPVSIGSVVWEDINVDGMQNELEPKIAGAVVTLYRETTPGSGVFVQVTTDIDGMTIGVAGALATGSNGLYEFENLPPANYKVRVTPPVSGGFVATPTQIGTDNSAVENDSNINLMASGVPAGTYESGVFLLSSLGEPTEADVTAGVDGDAQDGTLGSDDDLSGNMTVDFGFVAPMSIGSYVWEDSNYDGVQDSTEDPIVGATVSLLVEDPTDPGEFIPATDIAGVTINNFDTLASGEYEFTNLPPGTYKVRVTPPAGFEPTAFQDGNDDSDTLASDETDSNINASAMGVPAGTYESGEFTLSSGDEPQESDAAAGDDQDGLAGSPADENGNQTIDFGFIAPVSIASYVWNDADGDGVQDGGMAEQGIENATLTLYRETTLGSGVFTQVTTDIDGATIGVAGTLTTLADGLYEFDNLPPGNYKVRVTPPANYEPSLVQDGANNSDTLATDELDSNININTSTVLPLGTYESGEFLLTSGGEPAESNSAEGDGQDDTSTPDDLSGNMTVDFGFVYPVSIGSAVWEDINVDGMQDDGEPKIAGAEVTLYRETTAGSGIFEQVTTDIDGVEIGTAGALTTGLDGLYEFENLPPANYKVRVTPPASGGFVATPTQEGGDNSAVEDDSNINLSASGVPAGTYESGVFLLSSLGEPTEVDVTAGVDGDAQDGTLGSDDDRSGNMTVDFGFVPELSIGSLVWRDLNGDGFQDPNEPPISGAQVTLFVDDGSGMYVPAIDIDGNTVLPVTTGQDGLYEFEELRTGDYRVRVTPPSDSLTPTLVQNDTANDDTPNDSNINLESTDVVDGTYESATFTLSSGDEPNEAGPDTNRGDSQDGTPGSGDDLNGNMTVDFGFVTSATIGNYVWLDLDMDGVQDANENGIPGVEVTLTPPPGVDAGEGVDVPITVTTGPNGQYLFPDLPPYSNIDPTIGYVVTVDDSTLPPGLAQTYDEGETGVIGLLDHSSNGIQLSPMEEHLTADFGYAPPIGSIGDRVWVDADLPGNGDGMQDPGEPGIPGVTVTLTPPPDVDPDGPGPAMVGETITTMTDQNGNYLFTGLPLNETYIVTVVEATLPLGYVPDPDGSGDPDVRDGNSSDHDGITFVVLTTDNPVNLDSDFGYLPLESVNNSVGDTIWIDADSDGEGPAGANAGIDLTEQPVAGVTVALVDRATGTTIANTTTNASGQYLFTGIPDGSYNVVVTDQNNVLDGLEQTYDSDGVFTSNTSIVDLDSALISTVPIDDRDQDFGYVDSLGGTGVGVIGDTIFFDEDGEGDFDPGEGIEGVTVELYHPGSDGDITTTDDNYLVGSTTTGENGNYLFIDLDTSDTGTNPGTDYQVVVVTSTLPNGEEGWTNSVDPDTANPGDSQSVTTLFDDDLGTPENESQDLDQDFGYISGDGNSLSGTVWPDTNGDGELVEDGRFGNVTVELRDENGNIVKTTETDSDGNFDFMNLPDGIYVVVVTDENNVLTSFEHTDSPNGSSDTSDNTSKDDTGYRVDLDSLGLDDNPVSDATSDFGYEPTITNPISLGSFLASNIGDGEVTIEFATQTEVANLGFNLYALVDDQWVQLNDSLILSQGDSVSVQSYSATFNVSAEMFSISDIDLEGLETMHGPYPVGEVHGAIADRQTIDWKAEKAKREAKKAGREALRKQQQDERNMQRKLNRQSSLNYNVEPTMFSKVVNGAMALAIAVFVPDANAAEAIDLVNVQTKESGIHQLSHQQLVDYGIDLGGEQLADIALLNRGLPVAIQVTPSDLNAAEFGAGSVIRFIAQQLDTLYTDTNVYTLRLDAASARRIGVDDSSMPSGAYAASYLATKKFAPQAKYSFVSPDQSDPWYAKRLVAIDAPASENMVLELDEFAPGGNSGSTKAKMRVNVWGGTNLSGDTDDHHVTFSVNGEEVIDGSFDGLQAKEFNVELESLRSGNNVIKMTLPMDTGYAYDAVNLNEVEVKYPRKFVAIDGRLDFSSTFAKFYIPNFAKSGNELEPIVVAMREDKNGISSISAVDVSCRSTCRAIVAGSGKSAKYYVASEAALHVPDLAALPLQNDISSQQAKYLIISHPDFIGADGNFALEGLAEELASEMGSAQVVDVESIYAQFGDHIFDPAAIQQYIRFAHANLGTQYILLVGGDVYDYRQFETEDATSFIPSLYAATGNNITFAPVDAKYADINDDNVPDLPIGRLPVRTVEQLETLIAKRAAFNNRDYAGTALLVADGYDEAQQYDFSDDADEIELEYLGDWNVQKAYVDDLGTRAARGKATSEIEQGTTLTAFFGHSSTNQWSFSGLFTGPDAAALQNQGKPTVVTQWGCWNAYYVSPSEDSMGHRFMMEGDRGAVAVMGASTLTNANSERKLARLVFERMSNGERLGDAITNAKQDYAKDNPNDLDVLLGWTLLGMPDLLVN